MTGDLLGTLDPEQFAAATSKDGATIVRAGAGTGKTRTLVARILHLVRDRKVPPSEIMAVTFTNKSAREIRNRVADLLGPFVAAGLSVGTFHSLSARMLRRHPEAAGLKPKFCVAPEDDALRLTELAVVEAGILPPIEDASERARAVAPIAREAASVIQAWKSWGLTTAMVLDPNRPRRTDGEERLARVYIAYQDELQSRNLADFGDLVLKAVELLGRFPEIARREAGRVSHLLVDEAQDANPTQVRWARMMSATYRNLFVVGDEDQSIFSFQGGYPGAMIDMAPLATEFQLTINRRCTDEILAPAVALVDWNRRSRPKALASGVSGEKVDIRIAGNEREEATAIASQVKRAIAAGSPPSEIAILARSGWTMKPIEEALLKAGIDYELVGGTSLMKRTEMQDIAAFLRLVINPHDDIAFGRICNVPARGLGPAAEQEVLQLMKLQGIGAGAACRALSDVSGGRFQAEALAGIASFGVLLEYMVAAWDGGAGATTTDILAMVLADDGIGYRRYVAGGKKVERQRVDNLKVMERLAAEEPDLTAFLDDLSLTRDDDGSDRGEKVRLSTMHSAKGLEWDIVFCPALEADVMPNRRAITEIRLGSPADPWNGPSSGGMEEERRLLHVAFTRARKLLHLSSSASRAGKPAYPSAFLPESGIDPLLDSDPLGNRPVTKARASRAEPRAGRKGFRTLH